MHAKFFHATPTGLERRPILAAIMLYWAALSLGALLLALVVARGPRVPHPPYLATVAVTGSCSAFPA